MKFLSLFIFTFAFSQNFEYIKLGIHHVEVQGTAEIEVQTDEASFSFTILETGESFKQAVNKARKKMQDIISDLKNLGVKDSEISTSRFFSDQYLNEGFFSDKKEFSASVTTTLKLNDLELLEKTILAISELKPNRIGDVIFDLKNVEKHKENVLKMAVGAAYKKAENLAAASGAKVTKLLYSTEEFGGGVVNRMASSAVNVRGGILEASKLMRSDSGPIFQAQTRTITVTVRAIYQVE